MLLQSPHHTIIFVWNMIQQPALVINIVLLWNRKPPKDYQFLKDPYFMYQPSVNPTTSQNPPALENQADRETAGIGNCTCVCVVVNVIASKHAPCLCVCVRVCVCGLCVPVCVCVLIVCASVWVYMLLCSTGWYEQLQLNQVLCFISSCLFFSQIKHKINKSWFPFYTLHTEYFPVPGWNHLHALFTSLSKNASHA